MYKTLQKYLLQYIEICNRISADLLHIAICNNWYLIALHIYCNRSVIYWQRSGLGRPKNFKIRNKPPGFDTLDNLEKK